MALSAQKKLKKDIAKITKRVLSDKMFDAIGAFLKTQGWNVLVIGSPKITKPLGGFSYNYEFSVTFTGRQIKKTKNLVKKNAPA